MTRRLPIDGVFMALFVIGALFLAGRAWLAEHPQHNPWAPLDLRDPPGWATQRKLASLRSDPAECRAVLAALDAARFGTDTDIDVLALAERAARLEAALAAPAP